MRRSVKLEERLVNYSAVGSADLDYNGPLPVGYRVFGRTQVIGTGAARWEFAAHEVLRWGIKVRSGFAVARADGTPATAAPVRAGERFQLIAEVGPVKIWEPVQIISVLQQPARAGFSYGTLTGHPLSGEESFTVEHDSSDRVSLTIRSVSAPGTGIWRLAHPAVLLAQRYYRRRYFRALAGSLPT